MPLFISLNLHRLHFFNCFMILQVPDPANIWDHLHPAVGELGRRSEGQI